MSVFAGKWVANIEKSRRHANHQFKGATLSFEIAGDVVTLTHGGVNASGKHESGTTVLRADGQDHPVSPLAPGVVVATRWRDAHVLETVAKKDGQIAGDGAYEVSSDGTMLTATVAGIDGAGARFEQVIVFDRAAVLEKAFGYQGDNMHLPAKDVDAAVTFYETVLGFHVVSRAATPHKSAVLARDRVQIGLAENGGEPAQDGCAFHVENLEVLRSELKANGLVKDSYEFATETRGGSSWNVLYVVAPDGLCYWFGERQASP